jgi:hypothetical protein
MRHTRSTGAVGGVALFVLGLWAALIPFVGPYFHYGYGPDTTWHFTTNRLWLDILPGVVAAAGGLVLLLSRRRAASLAGAGLALAGGLWLLIGPSISLVWAHSTGGLLHSGIGTPLGGHDRAAAEAIGFFYGLGVLIAVIAAFEIGKLLALPSAPSDRGVLARSPGVVVPAQGAPVARMPQREAEREAVPYG